MIYIILPQENLLSNNQLSRLKKHIHNPIAKKGNELKHNCFILGMLFSGKPSH